MAPRTPCSVSVRKAWASAAGSLQCKAAAARTSGEGSAQQLHDRLRIPRQRRDSDDPLRRVDVLMQRSSKDLVEHVVAWLDDG